MGVKGIRASLEEIILLAQENMKDLKKLEKFANGRAAVRLRHRFLRIKLLCRSTSRDVLTTKAILIPEYRRKHVSKAGNPKLRAMAEERRKAQSRN